MKLSFLQKRFYSRSKRHKNECYGAVIDKKSGSQAIAYLEVNGKRENLIYKKSNESPGITVARETCILSPQLAGKNSSRRGILVLTSNFQEQCNTLAPTSMGEAIVILTYDVLNVLVNIYNKEKLV